VCPIIIADYVEDIYQTYIESQEKGQLGVAMRELSDMNPPPMNTMLERQSWEEAIVKRAERKGKTVKDVPPITPGNFNKVQKVPFNPSQGRCVMFFDISLSLFFSSLMKKCFILNTMENGLNFKCLVCQ